MNNEEKILAVLEKHGKMLEKHGEMLEKHGEMLARMQEDISDLRTTVTRVAVTQENIVIPQIKLLAEGHDLLLNTLARKDRVEALEDDMALLKAAIKAMSQRIEELEKAQ